MGRYAHGVFAIEKKARLLAVVLVLLALSSALLWYDRRMFVAEKTVENETPSQWEGSAQLRSAAAETTKDSDGDGLKDWEEAIWRTDPRNPDSDGDRTPDGEEIAQNRDPLKKGPNDKVEPLATSRESASPGTEGDGNNLTFNLTKNLLESGVLEAIGRDGRLTSTEFLENLSLPESIEADTLLRPATPVAPADLTVNQKNDPETIKQYFLALTAIFREYIAPHQQSGDIAILIEVFQSEDYERLAKLDPLIVALERTVAAVRRLPVPRGYERFAVQELDYLLKTKRAVEIFRNTQNDPLATAVAIRRRVELLTEIANFHIETIRELRAKGIDLRS